MRVELYGCPFDGRTPSIEQSTSILRVDFLGGVTSYTASPSTDRDLTYDGQFFLFRIEFFSSIDAFSV